MGEFEVHKGPIGVFVSPLYISLKDRTQVQGQFESREVTVKEKAWLIDYGASYAFGPWDLGKSTKLTLEPYAAGRYLHDDINISVSPGRTHDKTIKFNTPIIGLRAHWDFDNPWFLDIFGDYGGFGGVDNVNQTWQAVGMLGYPWVIRQEVLRDLNMHSKAVTTELLSHPCSSHHSSVGIIKGVSPLAGRL
jgi:hypothetical protein